MLLNLKKLIFGLNEFEKVKIDDRLNEVYSFSNQIKLTKLEDFEVLEECVYKIKEQLRVKSSNLNRTIKDTSNTLTKKKILQTIENLERIKYEFLKTAFTNFEPNSILNDNNNLNENIETKENNEVVDKIAAPTNMNINDINNISNKIENEEINNDNNSKLNNQIEIISDDDYKVILHNGKVPYLFLKFNNKIDYSKIKQVSSIFFDIYNPQGTNILIENDRILIIPRFVNDNLFELPIIKVDIDKTYDKIISRKELKSPKNEKSEDKDTKEEKIENKDSSTIKDSIPKDDYLTLDDSNRKEEFHTRKKEEESLDSLLMSPNHKKYNQKVEKSKSENKENNTENKENIKPSDEKPVILEGEHIEIINDDKKSDIKEYGDEKSLDKNLILYSDDKINVYLNKNSKVLGEVIIESINKTKINDINEGDLSYITIFSKIFASVLFEVASAQGTNIIWDFNDKCVRIIPRYDNDNLNIDIIGKTTQTEILDKVHEKLINEMKKEVKEEIPVNIPKKTDLIKESKEVKKEEEISKPTDNDSMEERAKYILNCLKRMP